MPAVRATSTQPTAPKAPPRARLLRERVGHWLTLAGSVIALIAFFCPWLDVFKTNDPTYPFPRRGYSPWMLLSSGRLDPSVVMTGVFLLLILGMAVSSLAAALAPTTRARSRAATTTGVLAVLSLVLLIVAVSSVAFDVSFSWPYLSSTVAYGLYLAVAGFLSVLIGLAALTSVPAWREYSCGIWLLAPAILPPHDDVSSPIGGRPPTHT